MKNIRTPLSMEEAATLAVKNTMTRKVQEAARGEGISEEEMLLRASSYQTSPRGGYILPITDGNRPIFDPEAPLRVLIKDANRQTVGEVVGGSGNFLPVDKSPVPGHETPTREYMWRNDQHARRRQDKAEYDSDDPLGTLRDVAEERRDTPAPEKRVLVTIGIPGTTSQIRMVAKKAFLSENKNMLILAFNEVPELAGIPCQIPLTAYLVPYSNTKPVTLTVTNFNMTFKDPDSGLHYLNLLLHTATSPTPVGKKEEADYAENWTHGWEADQVDQPPVR